MEIKEIRKPLTPLVALAIIMNMADTADENLNDENRDRQILLENLIADIRKTVKRVR